MTDHTEDRDTYYAALQRRVGQLHKLLTLMPDRNSPAVVALVLKSVLMAGIGYCGEELRDWWLRWIGAKLREEFGLCEFCGRHKEDPNERMCQTCYQSIDAEDLKAEIDLLMQQEKGGVQ